MGRVGRGNPKVVHGENEISGRNYGEDRRAGHARTPVSKTRAAGIRAIPSSGRRPANIQGAAGMESLVAAEAPRDEVIIHVAWNLGFGG